MYVYGGSVSKWCLTFKFIRSAKCSSVKFKTDFGDSEDYSSRVSCLITETGKSIKQLNGYCDAEFGCFYQLTRFYWYCNDKYTIMSSENDQVCLLITVQFAVTNISKATREFSMTLQILWYISISSQVKSIIFIAKVINHKISPASFMSCNTYIIWS